MPELKDAAEQFAKDLTSMNLPGLMMVFTPNGMAKAMAMQQQMMTAGQPARQATGYDVVVGAAEGEQTPVDIVLKNEEGSATIATRWQEVDGAWKVDDVGLKG